MLLLVDNYDSFTYNLYQYFSEFCSIEIIKNDDRALIERELTDYDALILSPGPGQPSKAGFMPEVIKAYHDKLPILGVCLGHQALIEHFGGKIVHADRVRHGKVSMIAHNQTGLFNDLPSPTSVMRYHSLVADKLSFPKDLMITAKSLDDDSIQGFCHKILPLYGVQFHPESIGTKLGKQMVANFLRIIHKKRKINA